MSKTNPVALVDIRVLDTLAGAHYVENNLQGKLDIIFCDSEAEEKLPADYLLGHGAVISNSVPKAHRHAGWIGRFWEKVFDSLSPDTKVVMVLANSSHWNIILEAEERAVPVRLAVSENDLRVEVV